MGCSASRSVDFIAHKGNPNLIASSSGCNSLLVPVSRTVSMPTRLVHHPPTRKGDSNHFVALTSTTYGSLLLDPTFNLESHESQMRRKDEEIRDLSSPDSVINTWEIMEGLDEDECVFQMVDCDNKSQMDSSEMLRSYEFVEHPVSRRPLWEHLSEESLLAEMDDNAVSSYRKALSGKRNSCEKPSSEAPKPQENESDESCCFLGAEDRIVVYYTSLRGIRKTYEDCCAIRAILRGFRVRVDERDISMDRSYRTQLQQALEGRSLTLPQVFIRGKYIGGAEAIKQLNEAGDLAKLLEGFPVTDPRLVCEVCGDARFVPCPNCNGSRKVYEQDDISLRRCPGCNENGLVRCSGCCS